MTLMTINKSLKSYANVSLHYAFGPHIFELSYSLKIFDGMTFLDKYIFIKF